VFTSGQALAGLGSPGSHAAERGPGQALWNRRTGKRPSDPGAFCAALLGALRYTLPEQVDRSIWEVALRHFAQTQPSETEFRQLLERRMQRRPSHRGSMHSADAGANVAAYLLREWEHYQLARRLAPGGPGGQRRDRAGAPGRRSPARRTERAAQVALLRRLGVPVPARRRAGKPRSGTPPPPEPDPGA
jgi:hypothetical protein